MDHLIENEGNPVPDLSSVSSTGTSTQPPGGGDPMDEDEDLEALRAVYGTSAGGSGPAQVDGEAKVRRSSSAITIRVPSPAETPDLSEYQVQRMR